LHRVPGVAFREDDSRARVDHAAENLAVRRHLAPNLRRQERTLRVGTKTKRRRCGGDHAHLRTVLAR
ncbi:MAG TPA: ISAs1 family transposase, partial [Thermomicrobiales bacterium]